MVSSNESTAELNAIFPSKKKHILVVDDDTRIRELISEYLQEQGYIITTAEDALTAEQALQLFHLDLLIVDVMMPVKTGFQFIQELRQSSYQTPAIMLTAMADIDDRITGFESGADDYLAKPFDPRELVFRIESILKRATPSLQNTDNANANDMISLGHLTFDPHKQRLFDKENQPVALTTTELMLLSLLIERLGQATPREIIVEYLATKGERLISERSVDVHMTRLRQKLESDPKKPLYLQTKWGAGYVLYSD